MQLVVAVRLTTCLLRCKAAVKRKVLDKLEKYFQEPCWPNVSTVPIATVKEFIKQKSEFSSIDFNIIPHKTKIKYIKSLIALEEFIKTNNQLTDTIVNVSNAIQAWNNGITNLQVTCSGGNNR